MKYYVFGSQSSQDLDILVIVEQLGYIQENKLKVVELQESMKGISKKEVNVNLGVITDSQLQSVFKGTIDEVNNSVMDTYSLHEQKYPLEITKRMTRDTDEKILRSARIVLSNLSRTQYRVEVKQGLKGDLITRINVLKNINFNTITKHDKYKLEDIYKTLAFQMGQAIGLIDGVELYTKEAISDQYDVLRPYLMRSPGCSLQGLEDFKNSYCESIISLASNMKSLNEKSPE